MSEIKLVFLEEIPEEIKDNTLYVSMEYATAIHNCMCGCGNKVITPLSPKDWNLLYDGETISLSPSIGNWNFNCESHYWIKKNKIVRAIDWPEKNIDNSDQENWWEQFFLRFTNRFSSFFN
ncbi:hypothetical protein KMW28_03665 [Flammeovirga yaeyamensis]|uniref:Uncharacterized protein n=2 Tax=Flammeovirga yaeyamensis TaxID=367791 RepID=A0AAX1N594_9BACT|nr:DUF6527 family protein [Flammeovirga yaeyamensis]MBB3701255.1 hypothetical protein [Flammeovirga yaeyamensis]QWG02686.1 hypothetical protein KMW28_03665 [Flammeovirga yaeyamensis]